MTQYTRNIIRAVAGSGKSPYSIHVSIAGTPKKTAPYISTNAAIVSCAVVGAAILPLLAFPSQANAQYRPAQNGQYLGLVNSAPYMSDELQFCQVSVGGTATAIGCSGTIPAKATVVYVTPETASVRCRGDGVAPTASVGQPVAANSQLTYGGEPLGNLQCIAQSGTATLDLWFFR